MKQAFVALGSNLDDPQSKILMALDLLAAEPGVTLLRRSPLYRTAPVGYLDQPDFINAVAEITTELAPLVLLDTLLAIEERMGRVRTFRNAPRTLDLDLLCYQDVTMCDETLTLPHPRMHERAFVLLPLNDIAPALQIGDHGTVAELAVKLDHQGVERLAY